MGPKVGLSEIHSLTRNGLLPRCGNIDPGTLAIASKKSKIKAVFMLVNWRQVNRRNPSAPMGGRVGACLDI